MKPKRSNTPPIAFTNDPDYPKGGDGFQTLLCRNCREGWTHIDRIVGQAPDFKLVGWCEICGCGFIIEFQQHKGNQLCRTTVSRRTNPDEGVDPDKAMCRVLLKREMLDDPELRRDNKGGTLPPTRAWTGRESS